MKINAEIFLEKSDQHKLINNIILISGNEFGLISKIQENIVSSVGSLQKADIVHCDFKNQKTSLDEIFNSDSLIIPHPKLYDRNYVLEPICEISPDLQCPITHKKMTQLLLDSKDLSKVSLYTH